jgi:hypothetical protein
MIKSSGYSRMGDTVEEWIVGGTLTLIGAFYFMWDVRNSLKPRGSSGDGGSDGDSSGESDGGGGGDGD